MEIFLVYGALGIVAGVAAGLFGVGGGVVVVPVLVYCFALQGMDPSVATHMAVGTSLATIVFTSLSSVWTHHRHGSVNWPLVRALLLGICLGSWFGGQLAHGLNGALLRFAFGLFACFVVVQMLWSSRTVRPRSLPGRAGLAVSGSFIGVLAALFGIGGGALTVPYLLRCGVSAAVAVATSAALGFPIAVVGAASFISSGWGLEALPAQSIGYVFWPAALSIVILSTPCARLGAKLAHYLPAAWLKRGFALFLALVGGQFLLSSAADVLALIS